MSHSLPTLRILSRICTKAKRARAPEQQRRIQRAVGSSAAPSGVAPGKSTCGRLTTTVWREGGSGAHNSRGLLRWPRDSSGQSGVIGALGLLLGMIMMQQRRSGEQDVHCRAAAAAAVIRGADGKLVCAKSVLSDLYVMSG